MYVNLRIVLSNKSPTCQWEEHVSSHVRAILFIVTCTYLPWWKLFFLWNLRNKETICSMVRHIHENEIWVTIDSWEDESLKCLQETDFNLFWSFFPSRRQTTNEVPIATVITTGTLPPVSSLCFMFKHQSSKYTKTSVDIRQNTRKYTIKDLLEQFNTHQLQSKYKWNLL